MSKSSKLTAAQRVVLAYYDVHRCGAMKFEGRWLWAAEVRENPAAAAAFIRDRADNYRDGELLRAWLTPDRHGRRQ
jgi:hypothetical protein